VAEPPKGLVTVVPALACPHCGAELDVDDGAGRLICLAGHAFDVARQGYVSLLAGGGAAVQADTTEMIEARARFLGAGWYEPFLDAVAGAVTGVGGVLLDCGAGEGAYLRRAADAADGVGIGLDLSKPAARRLARSGPRIGAVVANGWDRLPVADGAVAAVLSVFAPRNAAEFARVLAPDGAVVVLAPTTDHLRELIGPLGLISVQDNKVARLDGALGRYFELVSREPVVHRLMLPGEAITDLVGMGPNAHHGVGDRAAALAELTADGPIPVTAAATLSVFRRR
jgi:23S rRNA (guanine745-N1)-methyltransferase